MLQVLVHKHIQSSEHFCEVDHKAIEELGWDSNLCALPPRCMAWKVMRTEYEKLREKNWPYLYL